MLSFSIFQQTIGIDSEFCIVESLVTGLVDMFPDTLRPRRRQFTTAICILLFLLGLPMVTNGGAYVFQVRRADWVFAASTDAGICHRGLRQGTGSCVVFIFAHSVSALPIIMAVNNVPVRFKVQTAPLWKLHGRLIYSSAKLTFRLRKVKVLVLLEIVLELA